MLFSFSVFHLNFLHDLIARARYAHKQRVANIKSTSFWYLPTKKIVKSCWERTYVDSFMYLSLLYDDDLVEYQTSQEWNLNFQGKTLFSIFFYLKRNAYKDYSRTLWLYPSARTLSNSFGYEECTFRVAVAFAFFYLYRARRFFKTKINQIIHLYLGYRLAVQKVGPWWRRWSTRNHWRKSRGTRQTSRTTTAAALDQILYLRKTSPSSAPPGSCSSSALA